MSCHSRRQFLASYLCCCYSRPPHPFPGCLWEQHALGTSQASPSSDPHRRTPNPTERHRDFLQHKVRYRQKQNKTWIRYRDRSHQGNGIPENPRSPGPLQRETKYNMNKVQRQKPPRKWYSRKSMLANGHFLSNLRYRVDCFVSY